MGKSERDTVFSLAQQIIQHFLLIEHSPAIDQRLHWADEIDGYRDRIERKLSPTIRRHLKRELAEVFTLARRRVQRKGRVQHVGVCGARWSATARCPRPRCLRNCPYMLEQVLGECCPEIDLISRLDHSCLATEGRKRCSYVCSDWRFSV